MTWKHKPNKLFLLQGTSGCGLHHSNRNLPRIVCDSPLSSSQAVLWYRIFASNLRFVWQSRQWRTALPVLAGDASVSTEGSHKLCLWSNVLPDTQLLHLQHSFLPLWQYRNYAALGLRVLAPANPMTFALYPLITHPLPCIMCSGSSFSMAYPLRSISWAHAFSCFEQYACSLQ